MMALQLKHDLSKGKDIKNLTAGFILFRFENTTDHGGSQWVKVERLGEEALFLGKNESRLIVVSDADSLQGVKKNHIYFTEYEHGCFTGNTVDHHWDLDMGVYSLDDGSVTTSYQRNHI
ncbi:hypothetical protein QJS10_CPB15g01566 [Acorus calamus]|uniref:KIB1-4 beta-propeller domain-containing protein n=1 Tax=Acorus calamus TaxID=4465 RepID=A0AAV9D8Q7_ACOCL|nr:hypothetical protein QJS10_CPB15g01566 [Acorus calamus]